MRCLSTITILFHITLCAFSQLTPKEMVKIDSLQQVISEAKNDTILVAAYRSWNEIIYKSNPELSLKLSKKIIAICEKNLEQSNNARLVKEWKTNIAKSLIFMAFVHRQKGNTDKVFAIYKKCLRMAAAIENQKIIAACINNLANTYSDLGNPDKALEYRYRALNMAIAIKDTNVISHSLLNISHSHLELKNYDKAEPYTRKSLVLAKKREDHLLAAVCWENLGLIYKEKANLEKALSYYTKSLELNESEGFDRGTVGSLNSIGGIYADKNDYNKALEYFQKGLATAKKAGLKKGLVWSYLYIGHVYFEKGDLFQAKSYAEQSLQLAQELNFPQEIKNAAELLADIYKRQNKWKKAMEMIELSTTMRDTLNYIHTQKTAIQQEANYQIEKREQQLTFLKKEQVLKQQRFWLWIIIYSIILILVILVARLLYLQRKNRYEKELNTLRALQSEWEQEKHDEALETINVHLGKKIIPISVEDIAFFSTKERYVFLNLKDGKSYILDHTLKFLEQQLPENFIRVHHSYIINKDEILEINKTYNKKVVFTMKDTPKSKVKSSVRYIDNVADIIENE